MLYHIKVIGNDADIAERVKKLAVTKKAPYQKTVILRIPVVDIVEGEMFMVFADAQVTSPYTYNVMLSSDLVLIEADGAIREIVEGQGQNFNNEEHHFSWPRHGTYVATSNKPGTNFFALRAWSASSAAGSGAKLTVDQDYGRLTVWRFTPNV